MGLIIVIIALLLERFYNIGKILARAWLLSGYLRLVNPLVKYCNKVSPFLALFVLIITPILVLAGVYYFIADHLLGGLVVIFNLAILMISLGPDTLYSKWQAFCAAKAGSDSQLSAQLRTELVATDVEHGQHALPAGLLWQAYTGIFAVVFWFVILGWPVALLYRLVAQLALLSTDDEQANRLGLVALWVQQVLDWLPVRVMGLSLMLVGSFTQAFGVWFKYLVRGFSTNQTLLVEVALAALSTDKADSDDITMGNSLISLVERNGIVWVVVIGLFTVAQLF